MDATFYGGVTVLGSVIGCLFASGAFQGGTPPISSWTAFVFGEGLWIVWHALLLATLVGFAAAVVISLAMTADETYVAFVTFEISLGLLALLSLATSVLWSTTLYDAWAAKYIGGPALMLIGWCAVAALVLVYNQLLAYVLFGGWLSGVVSTLFVAGIVALDLLALHLYRA